MDRKTTNISLCAFADEAREDVGGQIAALRRNGIPMIELRGVDGVNIASIDSATARELRKRLDGGDISVWSLGSPYGKTDISADFKPELERFCRTLEVAGILGATRMRIFSFYGTGGGHFDEVAQRLSVMLDAAKKSGIILCHENEKNIYGDTPDRCAELAAVLPELRLIFDPANFIQCGVCDTAEAYRRLDGRIDYLHIKDATAAGSVVPAGKGIGQIPLLLRMFSQTGGGTVTLEPHLQHFTGLEKLENRGAEGIVSCYPDGDTAFDAAAAALMSALGNAGDM